MKPSEMTDGQLRIKVAELLGWKYEGSGNWIEPDGTPTVVLYPTGGYDNIVVGQGKYEEEVPPNYPYDLNACYEMEDDLTSIELCKYVQTLCGYTTRGEKIQWCGEAAGRACRATARQRCEAFVLVMGGSEMSFCPICGQGSGNGGDPCRRCEAAEARREALELDAKRQFQNAPLQQTTCVSCEKMRFCLMSDGEPLCEECFVKKYLEQEN